MLAGDGGMVERGDMSWKRQRNKLMLRLSSPLFGFPATAEAALTCCWTMKRSSAATS